MSAAPVFDFEGGTGLAIAADGTPGDPFETVDARQDPLRAAEISKALLEDDGDEPVIEAPSPGNLSLAAGLVIDGTVYRDATVRELNGADEEAISKATSAARIIDVIIRRATEHIGPLTDAVLDKALDDLLVGDRMQLLMEVRRATFGDTIRLPLVCPSCDERFEVDYSFSEDVPLKKLELDEPSQRVFEVELPSGKVAKLRLVDGKAQKAVYTVDNARKSSSEINTLLLQQVVQSLDNKPVKLLSHVREELSMPDREVLLDYLAEHQPGPQFGAVTQMCDQCEQSFPLVIDLVDTFRR